MTSWDVFCSGLKRRYPDATVQGPPSLGSANSARFVKDGFKFGIPNLRTRAGLKGALKDSRHWIYPARILLPGAVDSELFLAMVFSGRNLEKFEERLCALDHQSSDTKASKTNNTRLILHKSGLYATVTIEKDVIDPCSESDAYGPPVPVDEILFADVERGGRLTAAEVDVIERLRRDYSAPEKIVRLELEEAEIISPSENLSVDQLVNRVAALGGHYPRSVVESFHLNLSHNPRKHFVILRGISGTGKSRLAKCYAFAVLGASSLSEKHPRFTTVAVEPQWTDPSYLLGSEDILTAGGYRRTPFLEALLLADSDPMQPVFVLLDEMNRAQVEHYFASVLSAMELEDPIRFHSSGREQIPNVPSQIDWPTNLYIVGTINDDESVIPFSPMVLDRANSQDLSQVDVQEYAEWLKREQAELVSVLEPEVISELNTLSRILAPLDLHFGNRTIRDIALFLLAAKNNGSKMDAMDVQIDQRILPKLRGGNECLEMLNALAGVLQDRAASKRRVERMLSDLENTDFFKFR